MGYHDALLRRLRQAYADRSQRMAEALARHLPQVTFTTVAGASSYWVRFPEHVDTRALARDAAALGVLIEPGDVFFAANATSPVPFNYARLGFASIDASRIDAGLATLALACSVERRATGAASSSQQGPPAQD
jgi:GntR family transcriptional regulator/MocR family aminotransferase